MEELGTSGFHSSRTLRYGYQASDLLHYFCVRDYGDESELAGFEAAIGDHLVDRGSAYAQHRRGIPRPSSNGTTRLHCAAAQFDENGVPATQKPSPIRTGMARGISIARLRAYP